MLTVRAPPFDAAVFAVRFDEWFASLTADDPAECVAGGAGGVRGGSVFDPFFLVVVLVTVFIVGTFSRVFLVSGRCEKIPTAAASITARDQDRTLRICAVSTLRTAVGGSSTARTSAATICARVTRPSRRAESRVAGIRSSTQQTGVIGAGQRWPGPSTYQGRTKLAASPVPRRVASHSAHTPT